MFATFAESSQIRGQAEPSPVLMTSSSHHVRLLVDRLVVDRFVLVRVARCRVWLDHGVAGWAAIVGHTGPPGIPARGVLRAQVVVCESGFTCPWLAELRFQPFFDGDGIAQVLLIQLGKQPEEHVAANLAL